MNSLRDRLRSDTDALHRALDDKMSSLDLAEASDLAVFLSIHYDVFCQLRSHATELSEIETIREDLCARLAQDLEVLGVPLNDLQNARTVEADALAYIVLGSRMGSSVLKRAWKKTSDPLVRSASAYFTAPTFLDDWRSFCSRTSDASANSQDADRTVADAKYLFELFLAVTTEQLKPKREIHVA